MQSTFSSEDEDAELGSGSAPSRSGPRVSFAERVETSSEEATSPAPVTNLPGWISSGRGQNGVQGASYFSDSGLSSPERLRDNEAMTFASDSSDDGGPAPKGLQHTTEPSASDTGMPMPSDSIMLPMASSSSSSAPPPSRIPVPKRRLSNSRSQPEPGTPRQTDSSTVPADPILAGTY